MVISSITSSVAVATRRPGRWITIRWLILVSCTCLAFWNTIRAVVEEMSAQTLIVYAPVLVALCVVAAVGVSWRTVDEPPIYDRQTDVIVGIVVMVLAVAVKSLVNPRYERAYLTIHMDLLALWLYVFGAAVLLFGLRPAFRYRSVWLLFLLVCPLPVRAVVILLGGSYLAAGFVMVLVAMTATAIAVGRSPRTKAVAAVIAGAIGFVLLFALYVLVQFVDVPAFLLVGLAAFVGAMVARTIMLIDHHRRGGDTWGPPAPETVTTPKVPKVGRPLAVVVLVAIALANIPTPRIGDTWQSNTYPQLATGEPLLVPAGWQQESIGVYRWGTKLYGPGSLLYRQVLVQEEGSVAFDKDGRPRRVVVDSLDTRRRLAFEVYPDIFRYDLATDRSSLAVDIELAEGVTGRMWTVVDDARYLTYTVVSWMWNNGRRTQQVMLWAVDNHEPDAVFPEPRMTVLANMNSLLTVLLRGNSVMRDTNPQFKDRALLVGLASDLIRRQLSAAGEMS